MNMAGDHPASYQIHANGRMQFELAALMDLEYLGDDKMRWLKDEWDSGQPLPNHSIRPG